MRALRLAAAVLLAASLTFACSDQQPLPTAPTVDLDPVFAKGGQGKGKGQKVSYALEFDGSTQSTQNGDLDLGSTFTVELWAKPDDADVSIRDRTSSPNGGQAQRPRMPSGYVTEPFGCPPDRSPRTPSLLA